MSRGARQPTGRIARDDWTMRAGTGSIKPVIGIVLQRHRGCRPRRALACARVRPRRSDRVQRPRGAGYGSSSRTRWHRRVGRDRRCSRGGRRGGSAAAGPSGTERDSEPRGCDDGEYPRAAGRRHRGERGRGRDPAGRHGGVRSNYDDARESGERAGGAAWSRAGARAWPDQGFRPAEATVVGRRGRVAHHTPQQRPEHDGRRRYFAGDARHPRGAKSAPSPCSRAAQSTGGGCAAAAPAGTTASSPGHDLVRTRGRPGVGAAASACGARSSAGVFHAVTLASGPSATGLPEAEANRPSSLASGLTSFSGLHARRSATARRPNHNYGEGEGDESQAIERGRGTGCPGRRSSPGVR